MVTHICKKSDWKKAEKRGEYKTKSLKDDGFIHLSTVEQLVGTANSYYFRQKGLVILCVDESRLTAPLKWDAPSAIHAVRKAETFPHLYGPLNPDAVTKVIDFPCQPDGSFELPKELEP